MMIVKRKPVLFLSLVLSFFLFLSFIVLSPVSAKKNDQNDNRHKLFRTLTAKAGNRNLSNGKSNSRANVQNDNSVHIKQGRDGRNSSKRGGKNHKKNNNKKKVIKKKVVKKIDKDITRTDVNKDINIHHDVPQPPEEVVDYSPPESISNPASEEVMYPEDLVEEVSSPAPVIINNNENNNENTNVNEIHPVVVPVYVEQPVQEVASVQEEHIVYPVEDVTTTPETGVGEIALLSLPSMAGAGLFFRKKFRL